MDFSQFSNNSARAKAAISQRSTILNQYAQKLLNKSKIINNCRLEFDEMMKAKFQKVINESTSLQTEFDNILENLKAIEKRKNIVNKKNKGLLDKIHRIELETASIAQKTVIQIQKNDSTINLSLKIRNYEDLINNINGKISIMKMSIKNTETNKESSKKKLDFLNQEIILKKRNLEKVMKISFQNENKLANEQSFILKAVNKSNQSLLRTQFGIEERIRQILNSIKLCENNTYLIERKIKDQQFLFKTAERYLEDVNLELVNLNTMHESSQISYAQVEVEGKHNIDRQHDLSNSIKELSSDLSKARSLIKQEQQKIKKYTNEYLKGQKLVTEYFLISDEIESLYILNNQLESKIELIKQSKINDAQDSTESISLNMFFKERQDNILYEIDKQKKELKEIKIKIREIKKKISQKLGKKVYLEFKIKDLIAFPNSNNLSIKQISRNKAKEIQERIEDAKSLINSKNNCVKKLEHKILLEKSRLRDRKVLIKQEKERFIPKPKSSAADIERLELINSFFENSMKAVLIENTAWKSIDSSSDFKTLVNHWALSLNQIFSDFDTHLLDKI